MIDIILSRNICEKNNGGGLFVQNSFNFDLSNF